MGWCGEGMRKQRRTACSRAGKNCSAHRKLDARWDDAGLRDRVVDGRVVFVASDELVYSWVDAHGEERQKQRPHRSARRPRPVSKSSLQRAPRVMTPSRRGLTVVRSVRAVRPCST
eukprot:3693471-Prymnesium_polylepis.1